MANAATQRSGPEPKANMGAPVPRYDARLKVTGEARFASDMPVANPAYAVLVTSAIAKGRIASIDLDQARAVPELVYSRPRTTRPKLKPVKFGDGSATSIRNSALRFFTAARSSRWWLPTRSRLRAKPRDVKVSYDEQTPAATFGAQGLQEEDATKVSQQHQHLPQAGRRGRCDRRCRRYDRRRIRKHRPSIKNPMKLFTTTCAWIGDRLTVYEPSQFVYGLKNSVAQRLGIEPEKVDVISPYVGGAFGSKGTMTPRTAMIALAAKRLNRPVKLVATRAQGFTVSTLSR